MGGELGTAAEAWKAPKQPQEAACISREPAHHPLPRQTPISSSSLPCPAQHRPPATYTWRCGRRAPPPPARGGSCTRCSPPWPEGPPVSAHSHAAASMARHLLQRFPLHHWPQQAHRAQVPPPPLQVERRPPALLCRAALLLPLPAAAPAVCCCCPGGGSWPPPPLPPAPLLRQLLPPLLLLLLLPLLHPLQPLPPPRERHHAGAHRQPLRVPSAQWRCAPAAPPLQHPHRPRRLLSGRAAGKRRITGRQQCGAPGGKEKETHDTCAGSTCTIASSL